MIGISVLLNQLCDDGNSARVFAAACGKKITALYLNEANESLEISLDDGSRIRLYDDGQTCCEHRHMSTDDDLSAFVGATLMGGELRAGDTVESAVGDDDEIQFLDIKTDRGVFTMVNHNEHNGYYGGFSVRVIDMGSAS